MNKTESVAAIAVTSGAKIKIATTTVPHSKSVNL